MTGHRSVTAAAVLATVAVAASLAASSSAKPADKTTAMGRPSGVVADCAKGSGSRGGSLSREFGSRWNLVVGPLAMSGARAIPGGYSKSFGGNKFPLYIKAGHRITIALTSGTKERAALAYGPLPNGYVEVDDGHRVITFIACRRGQYSPGFGGPAGRLTFWSGGVLAIAPRCVPLLIWVDHERSPRRAVIHLGVPGCG